MNTKKILYYTGFTLIEILFVIALIGILATLSLIIVNPNREVQRVNNNERLGDITDLYRAIEQYDIDEGQYPSAMEALNGDVTIEICANNVSQGVCQTAGLLYVGQIVPQYIATIPKDPVDTTPNGTGYQIRYISTTGQWKVEAQNETAGVVLQVGSDI